MEILYEILEYLLWALLALLGFTVGWKSGTWIVEAIEGKEDDR